MNLQETVISIRNDFLSVNDISRDELIAICMQARLEEINIKYEHDFDKLLISLQQDCLDERDFDKLSQSINSLSNVLSILCTTLLNHIKFYSFSD